MLRKLFSSIFQSMHAPYSSLPSPPEFPRSPPPLEFPGPRDVDVVVDTTMAMAISSLPTDVLLEIFRRLDEPADVIRCADVCKPWRRAIIGNAASLQPRRHRFDPRLLLGVFHFSSYQARLRRTPGPFQSALPSNGVGRLGGYETARCLIPDASAAGLVVDRALYRELLWSADGFILLMARTVNRLCLFNPITGDCTFLPAAPASRCSAYVLLTGYEDDDASPPTGTGNKLAVRILAVQKRHRFMFSKEADEQGLSYQVLSTSGAGVWGPVQHSGGVDSEVEDEQGGLCVWMERRGTVVCRDAVYWLAGPSVRSITCTLAVDVRTGPTWTMELPQRYRLNSHTRYRLNSHTYPDTSVPILATSGDGRLSPMETLRGPRIQVWVMLNDGDDNARWTLQQTVEIDDMSNLLPPRWRKPDDDDLETLIKEMLKRDLSLIAFCPRSGCVVGICPNFGMEVLIDVHSGSPTRATLIGKRREHDCHPYEMDCLSTYISKMKHF